MKTIQEAIVFIKAEGTLAETEIIVHFSHLDVKFKDFLAKLVLEDERTKVAFHLIVQSMFEGKHLTAEEKLEVENQLKDLLKTVDLVAITLLPGGSLFLILAAFLKLNKYIIPSVFLEQK